jgi:hypothetical protein
VCGGGGWIAGAAQCHAPCMRHAHPSGGPWRWPCSSSPRSWTPCRPRHTCACVEGVEVVWRVWRVWGCSGRRRSSPRRPSYARGGRLRLGNSPAVTPLFPPRPRSRPQTTSTMPRVNAAQLRAADPSGGLPASTAWCTSFGSPTPSTSAGRNALKTWPATGRRTASTSPSASGCCTTRRATTVTYRDAAVAGKARRSNKKTNGVSQHHPHIRGGVAWRVAHGAWRVEGGAGRVRVKARQGEHGVQGRRSAGRACR